MLDSLKEYIERMQQEDMPKDQLLCYTARHFFKNIALLDMAFPYAKPLAVGKVLQILGEERKLKYFITEGDAKDLAALRYIFSAKDFSYEKWITLVNHVVGIFGNYVQGNERTHKTAHESFTETQNDDGWVWFNGRGCGGIKKQSQKNAVIVTLLSDHRMYGSLSQYNDE